MGWGVLDVCTGAAVLFFGIRGLRTGFARQMAVIMTFGITLLVLYFTYPALLEYLARSFPKMSSTTVTYFGLGALGLLAIGLFVLLKYLLASAMLVRVPAVVDKRIGFLFGLLRGGLIAVVALVLLAQLGSDNLRKYMTDHSAVGRWVCLSLLPPASEHLNRAAFERQVDTLRDRVNLLPPEEPDQIDPSTGPID